MKQEPVSHRLWRRVGGRGRRRPGYAEVTATVALVLAMSGGARTRAWTCSSVGQVALRAGLPWCAGDSCARTWISPTFRSTSCRVRPSSSELRMPV